MVVSKKRPRTKPATVSPLRPGCSRQDPRHWLNRLFKPGYTYKGRRFKVSNWAVKIQHQGKRKTLILRSNQRHEAAQEACELYCTLASSGWKGVLLAAGSARAGRPTSTSGFDAVYWAQRLIHRGYTMSPQRNDNKELSVRIEHLGVGQYFPLGTDNRHAATNRTLRIYQDIVSHGWEWVNLRYSRELTIAFRWLDVPLAWTYTTIHTQISGTPEKRPAASDGLSVAIVESDLGTRRTLEWCVSRMEGFRCVAAYANAAEALREVPGSPCQLALINHKLSDQPGSAFLAEMKAISRTAGLLYSVYEDSEELFRRTPGGAGTYLLKRTLPTAFLEPIASVSETGRLPADELIPTAWRYFKENLASLPVGVSARPLANLTQREHEVLTLIGKGYPDKFIAEDLGISVYTVHKHARNIFEKLGAHNRTEAAVRLLQK